MGTPFLWPGVRFDGQKRVSEVQWTEHKKGQARPLRGLVGSPFEHVNDASNEHNFCQGCQCGGVDAGVQARETERRQRPISSYPAAFGSMLLNLLLLR